MDEITVDRSTLKALGADTRIAILKKLSVRKMTQSELAQYLNLSVASISEHLKSLENANLVSRVQTTHKWKYFELTRKGASIVKPVGAKILLIVSLLLIALAFFVSYSQNLVPPGPIVDYSADYDAIDRAMGQEKAFAPVIAQSTVAPSAGNYSNSSSPGQK